MGFETLELILGLGMGLGAAYELSSFAAQVKVYGDELHMIREADRWVSPSPKRSRAYLDVIKTLLSPCGLSAYELLERESSQSLYSSDLKN